MEKSNDDTKKLRFLLRIASSGDDPPDRQRRLRLIRSTALNLGSRVVNPKWTSRGSLEVDVFSPGLADFETFLAAIEPFGRIEFVRNLSEAPRYMSKEATIEEALSLFNQERFWEAHEVLESLWRATSPGEEKSLLQGIILVCAAFVHLQKEDPPEIAMGIARRALRQLVWTPGCYHGIDVHALRHRVTDMVESGQLRLFEV